MEWEHQENLLNNLTNESSKQSMLRDNLSFFPFVGEWGVGLYNACWTLGYRDPKVHFQLDLFSGLLPTHNNFHSQIQIISEVIHKHTLLSGTIQWIKDFINEIFIVLLPDPITYVTNHQWGFIELTGVELWRHSKPKHCTTVKAKGLTWSLIFLLA